jgi:hypothetical protein
MDCDAWENCEGDSPSEALQFVIGKVMQIAAEEKEVLRDDILPESLLAHASSLSLDAQLNLLENLVGWMLSEKEDDDSKDRLRRELRGAAKSLANLCFDRGAPRPTLPVLLYDVEEGLVCAHAVELDLTARSSSDAKALRALKSEILRTFAEGRYDDDPSRIPYVPRPEIAARYEAARARRVRGSNEGDRIAKVGIPGEMEVLGYFARLAKAGGEGGSPGLYGYERARRTRT